METSCRRPPADGPHTRAPDRIPHEDTKARRRFLDSQFFVPPCLCVRFSDQRRRRRSVPTADCAHNKVTAPQFPLACHSGHAPRRMIRQHRIAPRSANRQSDRRRLGTQLANQLRHVLVACQEQNLNFVRQVEQDVQRVAGSLLVEVRQNVIPTRN
jgi:hypothetical protein